MIPRLAIADEIANRLTLIGTTSDYFGTRPQIIRARATPLALTQFPSAVVATLGETYERTLTRGTGGVYDRELQVEIAYWIVSDNAMDRDLAYVCHDVEYALRDWRLLNTSAVSTSDDLTFVSNQTTIDNSTEPKCGVTFIVAIRYRTLDQDPEQRA